MKKLVPGMHFKRAGSTFFFLVGEGVGQAARRRQWARQEEEKARWEREGQWLARLTGRNLARRGDFPS